MIIGILSLYVAAMLLFSPPSQGEFAELTAINLGFPILMALFFMTFMSRPLAPHASGSRRALLGAAIVVALASVAVIVIVIIEAVHGKKSGIIALALQILLVTAQSALLSYLLGVDPGIHSADFEARRPSVSVLMADGSTRNDLYLLKATEGDYRFVEADGAECLIPREQIRMVRAKPR